MIKDFYKGFEPTVEKTMNTREEHKAGERQLGKEPETGKPVFVKIGRFGPVVQIGSADDHLKPRFAQLPSDKSMETITLEEALELFKLPRTLGEVRGRRRGDRYRTLRTLRAAQQEICVAAQGGRPHVDFTGDGH